MIKTKHTAIKLLNINNTEKSQRHSQAENELQRKMKTFQINKRL